MYLLLLIVSLVLICLTVPMSSHATPLKPRIVVLTDISPINHEPDDMESLIRLLVHADLLEIEGLIATTGWSYSQVTTNNLKFIHKVVDAYEKDLPNLLKRSGQTDFLRDESRQEMGYWPSPDYLRSRTVLGSKYRGMKFIGADNNSDGSNLIIDQADEDDDRPIWVTVWGGGNTLAQAIWQVQQTRSDAELKAFLHKIRVYTITDQDRHYNGSEGYEVSSHQWMRREFEKDLFFIWDECAWKFQNGTGKSNWDEYATHIQGHGNLGNIYPKYRYGVEGDTPSFLHLMPNGLNNPGDPTQCGWGGYSLWQKGADQKTYAYTNQEGTTAYNTCQKYEKHLYPATFSNFAARMDWAKDGKGNRNPVVIIDDNEGIEILTRKPQPGTTVTLDASGTYDPDNDALTFNWWIQPEAGTYSENVTISNSESSVATVNVPSDSEGKTFHVICEVTDNGTHNLTSYCRIIFEPTSPSLINASANSEVEEPDTTAKRLRVIMSSDFPPIGVVKEGNIPNTMKSDPDDMQSMVRFLLYANEFDIEGLIASAGTFAMEAHKKNILGVLDQYEKVYENLKKHDPDYPTADYLRSVTFEGKGNNHGIPIKWGRNKQPYTDIIGEGMDSEASNAIIAAADKPDPRPLWIGVWGGPREIAQAIWDVKNARSEEELKAFISKLRVYLIAYQDATHGWLIDEFPDLFIIESIKTYGGIMGGRDPISDLAWVNENIRHNHGPLCDVYPHEGIGCTGVCEGDSPTFLYLVSANRGINDPEDPTQPSWGGQYKRKPNTNHYIDGPGGSSISKWRKDYQKEFQERADWCISH